MRASNEGLDQFVEEAGLIFEEVGFPRMAGRLLGWLLVCQPPHQSARELATALQASAGSISGMTHLLIQLHAIERISLPGERRDYFRMRPGVWAELGHERLLQVRRFRRLADLGIEAVGDESPRRAGLEELRDFYGFIEEAIREALARWESARSGTGPAAGRGS
jgi:DNA-binding transcriptional regulator GbsR (MarR family)